MRNTVIFCAGMGFGSLITYLIMKNRRVLEKQNDIFDEKDDFHVEPPVEEDSKVYFSRYSQDNDFAKVDATPSRTIPEAVINTIQKYQGLDDDGAIYYITADEFGENEDYDNITLTYFVEDDILADEDDSIISSPNDLVGDFKPHFGEEEEDVVYVKNDEVKCYFEVIKDLRKYDEIPRPHRGILNERYR